MGACRRRRRSCAAVNAWPTTSSSFFSECCRIMPARWDIRCRSFTSQITGRCAIEPHEQLNGLWTVGVTRYPVISELPDGWNGVARDMKNAYRSAVANGFTRDRLVELQVEYLRRFRPQVVVGHDPNGEYGHPQHIINTETLMDALTLAADPTILGGDSRRLRRLGCAEDLSSPLR